MGVEGKVGGCSPFVEVRCDRHGADPKAALRMAVAGKVQLHYHHCGMTRNGRVVVENVHRRKVAGGEIAGERGLGSVASRYQGAQRVRDQMTVHWMESRHLGRS